MMVPVILAFLLAREGLSSCLQSLVPSGHIQISITPDNGLEYQGPLLQLQSQAFSVFDSCVDGFAPPPSAYVIILHPGDDLAESLDRLSCNHQRWWPAVWTVVVLKNATLGRTRAEEFARGVIHQLWKKAVYSCAVLIEDSNLVFKADPFLSGNGCGRIPVNLRRGNCTVTPLPYRSRFPGCELQVSGRNTFPFSKPHGLGFKGVDANLVKLIAEKSNLVIKWTRRPNRYTASYQVAHAYYENISRNKLDLAIGGSVVSITYFSNVTYGVSHVMQYLYYYVADSSELRGWRMLLAMFSLKIWLSILFSVLFCVLILTYYGDKSVQDYSLLVLGILLQETVTLPKGKLRMVLMCIVFPFFFLSTTYTTILHSYTMNPPDSDGVKTLDDIINAKYSVMVSDTNRFIIKKTGSTRILKSLKNRTIPYPGLEEAARQLEAFKNFTLVERDLEMDCLIARDGYKVHNIEFKMANIMNSIVYPKGSQYGSRFHKLVRRVIESGLTDQWMEDLVNLKELNRPILRDKRALGWHDVEAAFTILFSGYLLSLLTFIVELIVAKYMDQNKEILMLHSRVYK